jgi:hypothetical protein
MGRSINKAEPIDVAGWALRHFSLDQARSIYMAEWGTPSSATQRRKMEESIAAFTRNAKRRAFPKLAVTITEWEGDLEYLRKVYYVGRYDFNWPN